MSDKLESKPAVDSEPAEEFTPITSQEEFTRLVGERLARERAKLLAGRRRGRPGHR